MAKKKRFEGQYEDEDVKLVFRRHPIVMRKGLLIMLVVLTISMIPLAIFPTELKYAWLVLGGLGLGMLIIFYSWIGWYFSMVIVTNERLIKITQSGLFKRSVVDVGLGKILSVNYQIVGLQETLLGFGTIVLQTYVGDLVLEFIHHPDKTQNQIVQVIQEGGFEVAEEEIPTGSSQKGEAS